MTNYGSKYLKNELYKANDTIIRLRQENVRMGDETTKYQQQVLGICSGTLLQAVRRVIQLRKFYKNNDNEK